MNDEGESDESGERIAGTRPLALALSVSASLLWLPQAGLIALAIGQLASAQTNYSPAWLAIAVFLIGGVRALLEAASARIAFRDARRSLSVHRARATEALAHSSPLDKSRAPSGTTASIIAEQADMIVPYLTRYRIAKWRATLVPPLFLLAIVPFSWAAALALLLAAPMIPIFMALIGWRAESESKAQLHATGSMNAFVLDRLRGIATIRSLDAVEATATRMRAEAERVRAGTMSVLRIAFLSSAVLELFSAIGVAMVAVYVGFHLLGPLSFGAWGDKLTLAEGLFILLLAPAFFDPLRDLSTVWHDRAAGEAAIDAIGKLASQSPTIVGDTHHTPSRSRGASPPAVRLEDLTFRYAEDTAPAIEAFHLDITAGEHVALLGASGSGKSTILAIIAGLAKPERGSVLIGGQKLSDETAAELRNCMGWVGQRPHIFPGTLQSNVSLGRQAVDKETVASALVEARLADLAATRNAATIGEGGVGLSGGEALRVALARVTANRDAVLILADEPTAHLDAETANEIADHLVRIARGKTLIVATHDPRLAARMDRIVRLDRHGWEDAA